MHIFFKILAFLAIAALGASVYALTFNALVLMDFMPPAEQFPGFGHTMTSRAVVLWLATLLPCIASFFIQGKWRYLLMLMPLYIPSAFAVYLALSIQQVP